jgi:hypothetical protein
VRRSTLTWVVNLAGFVGVVLLVATGFLLHYVLPAGSGSLQGIGTGLRAAARPITLMLGLTRHEWGEMHFWIAVGLMGILALHLLMHWRWIVCLLRGEPRDAAGGRVALGIIGLLGLLAVAVAPFLADPCPAPPHEGGPDQPRGPEWSMKSRSGVPWWQTIQD